VFFWHAFEGPYELQITSDSTDLQEESANSSQSNSKYTLLTCANRRSSTSGLDRRRARSARSTRGSRGSRSGEGLSRQGGRLGDARRAVPVVVMRLAGGSSDGVVVVVIVVAVRHRCRRSGGRCDASSDGGCGDSG